MGGSRLDREGANSLLAQLLAELLASPTTSRPHTPGG
jgi:hypothetical protein